MKLATKILAKLPIRQLFFFGLSGVIGYLVDASITTALKPFLGVYIARIPAFIAAATVTWLVNRNLTFGAHTSRHSSLTKEYAHYLSLMLIGMTVNYAAYAISISLFPNIPHALLICVAVGSLAGMIVNFVTSKRYIYRQTNAS